MRAAGCGRNPAPGHLARAGRSTYHGAQAGVRSADRKRMAPRRKLTTILATDVAGFSGMMARDDETTHASLGSCRQVLDSLVTDNGGRIFGSAGDSFVAEFASPVAAVRCAVSFQGAMAVRNTALPEPERLVFRVGVNVGDVIVDGGNLYGDGVNTAVRLEAIADPGGLVISSETYALVRNKIAASFEDLGVKALKNLPDPVHVFRVLPGIAAAAQTAPQAVAQAVRRERPSIVVLPFSNLGGDPAQDYFRDGLVQDLTTDLSRFRGLFVIGTHSAFTYKDRAVKAQQIGQELGVRYILEGSVRLGSGRVRINAQLIEAETGHGLWADRFERETADLFLITDEINARIVATIAPQVALAERRRALRVAARSPHAYDSFLRGSHAIASHMTEWHENEAGLAEARQWFERAIEQEPGYARAWGLLAYTTMQTWLNGWRDRAAVDEAEQAAARAVALDPDDYDTHWALAFVHSSLGRFDAAQEEFQRALDLNPNDAGLLVESAETLTYLGRHAEAVERIHLAMTINPRFPEWYRWNLGWALHVARDYAESNRELMRIARPSNEVLAMLAANHARLAEACAAAHDRTGRDRHRAEAAAFLHRFRAKRPDWTLAIERTKHAFRETADLEHWLTSLRLAGLPE